MNGRAMERLTNEHLEGIGALAAADREDLFARHPHLAHLRERILCVALCQGGALHWVDGKNGVKDLDVYTFYAATDEGPRFPPRRVIQVGHTAAGLTDWQERVDIQGRSIPRVEGAPIESVVAYLQRPRTATALHLAQKAVVLIEPGDRIGEIVWPPGAKRAP